MNLLKLFLILQLIAIVLADKKHHKFKYKVVKPKKKCVITNESTFSVTGFLTFAVVSVTAVANVLANINNNNDNNNNNNNQDNVNNNNQMSSSADATNMGNARSVFNSNKNLFCFAAKSEDLLDNELGTLMTSVMGYYLADQLPNFKHEDVPKILHNPDKYC